MSKAISFMCGLLLVLLAWESAHPQSSTTKKDYKVVDTDYIIESGKGVSIVEYAFRGSTIKTREKYFDDRKTQDDGLEAATKEYVGCGPQIDIFDNTGTILGRKIVCEDIPSKSYVIAYSHYDSLNKVNVISGESRLKVEEFVKGICPYAYHLYPDIECPGEKSNDDEIRQSLSDSVRLTRSFEDITLIRDELITRIRENYEALQKIDVVDWGSEGSEGQGL